MKFEDYNNSLRELIKELISDGYSKAQICNATLGSQRGPQFQGFIDDKNLGIKPLTRMINGLNYDLHLVAIPNNDVEKEQVLSELNGDFEDNLKFNLIEYLESVKKTKEEDKVNKTNLFDEVASSIIDNL